MHIQDHEWNHGNAAYGIKPQELYSIRASHNAMRDFVAIPYNVRGALIACQAWDLETKKELLVDKSSFFVGGEGEIRTLEPLLTVTRFPVVRPRPTRRLLHEILPTLLHRPVYDTTK